jgi:hypothetical protein
MAALARLACFDFAASPAVFGIVWFCYLTFQLFFHALIDHGAAAAKRYVPFSNAVSVAVGICGVFGPLVILEAGFGKNMRGCT